MNNIYEKLVGMHILGTNPDSIKERNGIVTFAGKDDQGEFVTVMWKFKQKFWIERFPMEAIEPIEAFVNLGNKKTPWK